MKVEVRINISCFVFLFGNDGLEKSPEISETKKELRFRVCVEWIKIILLNLN